MATTGYAAGVDANDVELSYGKEATWGTKPASAFQGIRYTGESFSGSKTRQRPSEINTSGQASAAITTQEQAQAGVNFALSFGTYDDMLAGLLNGDWTSALAISGTDISFDGTDSLIESITSGKFSNVVVGQWIKVAGAGQATNNGFHRVVSKLDNQTLELASPLTTEAAGASVTISGSILTNGTTFQSFHFQKRFSANQFLVYPGVYLTGGSLTAGLGQFMQGNFQGVAKSEEKATTSQSTGAVLAAPTGRVHDTINGFQALELDGAAVAAVVDSFNIQITKEGAGGQYGLGSAAAQGMTKGTFTLSGSLRTYFKDFQIYDLFKSEAQGLLSYRTTDADGNAYVLTIPAANLMNPQVVAGGAGQPVMAEFQLEGNPHPTLGYTFQIDRFAA